MYKLLTAVAAAALAAPALAQPADRHDPIADGIARAMNQAEDVEAMAPALDRSVGALMNVDVGPIIDAVDPWRRHPDYGRPGRTIGRMAARDDPHFQDRVRSSIYGATADMSRMMGAFAAAAPALAQSIRQVERAMEIAIDDYHRRRGAPDRRREDGEPHPED